MTITKEALEEFKAVYKREFGINLTDDEAREKAELLMAKNENNEKDSLPKKD